VAVLLEWRCYCGAGSRNRVALIYRMAAGNIGSGALLLRWQLDSDPLQLATTTVRSHLQV
jgi:hypothetical protein